MVCTRVAMKTSCRRSPARKSFFVATFFSWAARQTAEWEVQSFFWQTLLQWYVTSRSLSLSSMSVQALQWVEVDLPQWVQVPFGGVWVAIGSAW
jgi:hypothetical protein